MRKRTLPAWFGALLLAVGLIQASGCASSTGTAGAPGTSCTASKTGGVTTITCSDGNVVTINDGLQGDKGDKGSVGDKGDKGDKGADGANTTPCDVKDNGDGTKKVTCGTTSVTLYDGITGTDGAPGEPGKAGDKGDKGDPGVDGQPCEVVNNGDGTKTINCNGISVQLPNGATGDTGAPGTPGEPGLKGDPGDKGDPGTPGDKGDKGDPGIPGAAGKDAKPCTVKDLGTGSIVITCADGSMITIGDGVPADSFIVKHFHGIDYLMSSGQFKTGAKYLADSKILSVAIDDTTGKVTVVYSVTKSTTDATGKVTTTPVTGLTAVGFALAKLVPPGNGEASSYWVSYIYTKATAGLCAPTNIPCWNDPPFSVTSTAVEYVPTRESANADPTKGGTLTESTTTPGTYTYVSLLNVKAAKKDTTPITYDPTLTHRVAIMMGGSAGATSNTNYDFVPATPTVPPTYTRDIVQTDTCKQCHGPLFKAHGGDRLTVETCVMCHNPGNKDVQSGNSIDFKVMLHKIHAGAEMDSIPGPNGQVFDDPATTGTDESSDNGKYVIWGFGNNMFTWWDVGYPAVIENCTKCHQGSGAQVNNWKSVPSRAACGSCHDLTSFAADTTNHKGFGQADDGGCTMCHKADVDSIAPSIAKSHDWLRQDARKISEFKVEMSVTLPSATPGVMGVAPASGYFSGSDTPVVNIVLKDINTGAVVNTASLPQDVTVEGCVLDTADPTKCTVAGDGLYTTASLFVHGPRGKNKAVLGYSARAAIVSNVDGPYNLTGAKSLGFIFDGGKDIMGVDATGGDYTKAAAFSVTIAGAATVTTDALITTLNNDSKFKLRGIAYKDELTNRLAVRSRNLGELFAVQLVASTIAGDPVNKVFAGDVSVHTVGPYTNFPPKYTGTSLGLSTVSNKLFSTVVPAKDTLPATIQTFVDPKVKWYADHIEYTLDPVTDLAAGTYIANIELADRGLKTGGVDYKTPSVGRVTFQVGTKTEELPVAGNCNSCHQGPDDTLLPNGNLSPDGKKGLVFDYNRHHKLFDFFATDMCGACHDQEPQGSVGDWSGAKSISRRVHAVHNGSKLTYPNTTVGHADEPAGRNWDIAFPQDIRNCEVCHVAGKTSGTWATKPARIPCMGCHDKDAATAHLKSMTYDPTPLNPWSGDEQESCVNCHAP